MSTINGFPVKTIADIPDFRDRYYEPALIQLKPEMVPPKDLIILNQGKEGACTGFGLAAVINKLNQDRGAPIRVSPRMLYEMAKKFDRWAGEEYSGSSCRGAIKGWHSMGVCTEKKWPYTAKSTDTNLTVERAKEARSNTIGAYYRLRKNIVDMHAAFNQVGAIYVSAKVHKGWSRLAVKGGRIKLQKTPTGAHAFAIVGYDKKGFWIQNSWGASWGKGGLAHWSYEDWQENVMDAWVVRLALPTPQLYGGSQTFSQGGAVKGFFSSGPRREAIAGHFVHIDDGKFHDEGKYWSNLYDVRMTAKRMAGADKYKHLLIYAHGGLNSIKASATRIAAMKNVYRNNGIYPFHFMYDTGLMEELKDVIFGKRKKTEEMAGGFFDWWDTIFEKTTRVAGRSLWREMKYGARASFEKNTTPGSQTMNAFISALKSPSAKPKAIHMVGHSTGAILLAYLLNALKRLGVKTRIASVSLLAPACTVDLFYSHFLPLLKTGKKKFGVDKLNIYNLNEKLEQDDHVAQVYRKSLLYLVSNAYEEEKGDAILGMKKFSKKIQKHQKLNFIYSKGARRGNPRTRSESHGGFDNDTSTMNDILETVLKKKPARPFRKRDLDY